MKHKRKSRISSGFLTVAISLVSLFALGIGTTSAATDPYRAAISSASVTMAPGEIKTITLKFKNVGTKTWTRGKTATAVFVYGKSSVFGTASWLADDLPALIDQKTVKSGKMASASFTIKAPKTPGTYSERFLLSYGANEWVRGSVISVAINVQKPVPVPVIPLPAPPSAASTSTAAILPSGFKATLANKGGIEWQLQPGERTTITLVFKNTGEKTWIKTGTGYVSLYTWSPKYRTSAFRSATWVKETQPATMKETRVTPGNTGTFTFELLAPQTDGAYQESFQLAAEDAAWVEGGSATLPIRVGGGDDFVGTDVKPTDVAQPTAKLQQSSGGTYQSVFLLTSNKQISMGGSERLQLTHGFKNAGTATWQSWALKLVSVAPALGAYSSVHDSSWLTADKAAEQTGKTAPGAIGFVSYTLKAPARSGAYQVTFRLTADGKDVEGGEITIPVTVTSDGMIDPTPIPISGSIVTPGVPAPLNGDESTLPAEPIIRVGLFKTTDDALAVRGVQTSIVVTQNGSTVCTVPQGQVVTDVYDRANKVYKLSGSGCVGQSSGWYVFVAADGVSPLEITDYSRPVSWLPGANDNTFRAKLELRYTPATDAVWVINELLLESYLNGIAETSNVSPLEYQKALLTAARTYALYHVNRATKHASEFYHVDAHLDQVYRGYGQEARSPNIVDGVRSTRGQIVTYDGKLAITPYYSRSDGRTRDWTEVWGGSGFAWLKSVPVPYDVGQTLWGHGVGLSARGALYMASKDSATYDAILKHFYTGIDLRRAYK